MEMFICWTLLLEERRSISDEGGDVVDSVGLGELQIANFQDIDS